jgi:hypothetical protein
VIGLADAAQPPQKTSVKPKTSVKLSDVVERVGGLGMSEVSGVMKTFVESSLLSTIACSKHRGLGITGRLYSYS